MVVAWGLAFNNCLNMMKLLSSKLYVKNDQENYTARAFCDDFLSGRQPRYILGRNIYAASIAQQVDVLGFIDEYTNEVEFLGKPILKMNDLPESAMVVSAVVLRPLTAKEKLVKRNIRQIDYFSFRKYSGIKTEPALFWDEFEVDFDTHRDKYEWIYSLLADDESRETMEKLVNFHLSSDLNYMKGFTDLQHRQYFEEFLQLEPSGEVFVDVGGYDAYTTLEFINRCPNYLAVHVFEPESKNMTVIQGRLKECPNVHLHLCGLSNIPQILRFSANGSASQISEDGELEIRVVRLDDVLHEKATFIKMDVEGAELQALEGAKRVIIADHPRLAVSVYHRVDDFWRIPELILSYQKEFKIYLRHYTEGVTESVMFFIPVRGK